MRWFDSNFDAPRVRVRVTTSRWGKTRPKFTAYRAMERPANLEPSITRLRKAPVWAALTPTARRLADYLLKTTPRDSLAMTTTYREIQNAAHIGNRATLKRALSQITDLGLIETAREATGKEGFGYYASRTTIRLTWGAEKLQQSLFAMGGTATKYIGSKVNHESDKKVNHEERGANGHKTEPREGTGKPMQTKRKLGDGKGRFEAFERAVREAAGAGITDLYEISAKGCWAAHDSRQEFPFNALGAVKSLLNWQSREGERVQ
jgi:hypothetical protein